MKQILLLYYLFAATISTHAQDTSTLSTDRPDQTDGTNMLRPKEFQVETELYHNTFNEGRAAIISSTLLRYGLLKNVELRMLVEEGRERDKFIEETAQGLFPFALSAKISLLKEHPVLPDIAFITYFKMPLTRRTSEDVYWSPLFMLAFEKELNKVTLAANSGIRQATFGTNWLWQASTEVKYEISDRVEVYSEYFAQYARTEKPNNNIDGGLLVYLNNNWMVHAAYGTKIFTHKPNHFVNTGVAVRIK